MFSSFPIPPPVRPVRGDNVLAWWDHNIDFEACERQALRWHCACLGIDDDPSRDSEVNVQEVSAFDPTAIDRDTGEFGDNDDADRDATLSVSDGGGELPDDPATDIEFESDGVEMWSPSSRASSPHPIVAFAEEPTSPTAAAPRLDMVASGRPPIDPGVLASNQELLDLLFDDGSAPRSPAVDPADSPLAGDTVEPTIGATSRRNQPCLFQSCSHS